jgi:uncharacterized protein (TIGR03084 family)
VADPARLAAVRDDLAAEHRALDDLVGTLTEADFDRPTPAPGWSIRDQLSHLAWFDERALESVVTPEKFVAGAEALLAGWPASMEVPVQVGRAMSSSGVMVWWRAARAELLRAFAGLDPDARLPWYGPPMGAVSFVTARLMETWAHGEDIADTLGVERPATDRLRHVAHIGFAALGFSFVSHDLVPPAGPVRVELVGPGGDLWTWGVPEAADRVSGPALDFCRVVTQRRHRDDTELEVHGPVAIEWISIAQAFAGPPGEGRRPGQFPRLPG